MNASKENCQEAIDNVELWFEAVEGSAREEAKNEVLDFLRAAKRKLPSEASFPKPKHLGEVKNK